MQDVYTITNIIFIPKLIYSIHLYLFSPNLRNLLLFLHFIVDICCKLDYDSISYNITYYNFNRRFQMKKLILTLAILILASTLFASDQAAFHLNAQVKGILFHGFTTNVYNNSDELLKAQNEIEQDAQVYGLNLTSNASQSIGSYAFYSTSTVQSLVTFETSPLYLKVLNDEYFVPYKLTTGSKINSKIELLDQTVGQPLQATTDGKGLNQEAKILMTNEESTGLRYGILDLAVEFAGDKNVSFGLPEASDKNYYTGTITAKIHIN